MSDTSDSSVVTYDIPKDVFKTIVRIGSLSFSLSQTQLGVDVTAYSTDSPESVLASGFIQYPESNVQLFERLVGEEDDEDLPAGFPGSMRSAEPIDGTPIDVNAEVV